MQAEHTRFSKDQIDYTRLNSEYDFIKKRSLINFLGNEKLNLDQHFHERTLNMLGAIQRYERQNLDQQIKNVASASFDSVLEAVKNTQADHFRRNAFETALEGIRSGQMQYQGDAILPLLNQEIQKRTSEFKGLSKEEESRLLQLTAD